MWQDFKEKIGVSNKSRSKAKGILDELFGNTYTFVCGFEKTDE